MDASDNKAPKRTLGGDNTRRRLAARWVVTCRLRTTSAALFGQVEGDVADMTFERTDGGKPVLRGASLAGALRSHLCDRLAGYRGLEDDTVKRLFGSQTKEHAHESRLICKEHAHESRLICYDAVASTSAASVLRDGVRIDSMTRLAVDKAKYDAELMGAGAVFPLRFDLIVKADDKEAELLAGLGAVLDALHAGEIALGARKTRGRGRTKATDFRAVRFDLKSKEGWDKYGNLGYDAHALDSEPTAPNAPSELLNQLSQCKPVIIETKQKAIILRFDLQIPHTLLIRSPGQTAQSADVIHLQETRDGKPAMILSGTSVAGVLRSQAARILRTMGKPQAQTDILLNDLFGSAEKGKVRGSRFRVEDGVIQDAGTHRQSRVKIDRFTGGAFDTALFDEEPSIGGTVCFTAQIRKTNESECDDDKKQRETCDLPLMLLVCRDLLDGLVTIGGATAIGRGRVHGKICIEFGDQTYTIEGNGVDAKIVKPANDNVLNALQKYGG